MKTTGFASISVEPIDGGIVQLNAYEPSMGYFEMHMSAEELMLFLVEAGNTLALARREEIRKQKQLEYLREIHR